MNQLKQGILIAVEGIDGSGKSTLALNLYHQLRTLYQPIVLTKEPGDSKLGLQLRTLLQEKPVPICPKAEYLLFAADRAQHIAETVMPALKNKSIVISDRMADSSLVYQGFGRGLDLSIIDTINQWAMNNIKPDIVLYLAIPLEIALERIRVRKKPLTSFEQEQVGFTQKLLTGFDVIFKERKEVVYLDGTQSPETVTQKALTYVEQCINTKKLDT